MAQHSKKDQIATAALPLFLANGFKGTSVDMVVKAAGVSKPTVYNHFPDKAALLAFVVEKRLAELPAPSIRVQTIAEYQVAADERFFDDEVLGLYAMVIGEGKRFPEAKTLFMSTFEQNWRAEITRAAAEQELDEVTMQMMFSHALLGKLLKTK